MKPNIIFYFSDQQRADTFNREVMPELSAIAEDGVSFDNAYTCQPVCGPARSCLQTGEYATETGCFINGIPLPRGRKFLADYMKGAGYEVGYVGKWHLASGKRYHYERTAVPEEARGGYSGYWRASDILEFTSHGYDGFVFDENNNKREFKGYRVDAIESYVEDFINTYKEDKPFFLFVSQLEPHHQNDHGHFEGYKPTIDKFRDYPLPSDVTYLGGDCKQEYPDYLSAINRLDYNVGRLVQLLKNKGIYDNTVLIYTSDHGCHFKTRNLEYKRSPHDSATHIPLVVTGGYVKKFRGAGKHSKSLISLIDLPMTLLDLAGAEIPKSFKGKSIVEILDYPDKHIREDVFIQISESQTGRAVRTDKYLYAVAVEFGGYAAGMTKSASKTYRERYLYDVIADPDQRVNLIKSPRYKKVRAELRERLIKNMTEAGEQEPRIRSALFARKK